MCIYQTASFLFWVSEAIGWLGFLHPTIVNNYLVVYTGVNTCLHLCKQTFNPCDLSC